MDRPPGTAAFAKQLEEWELSELQNAAKALTDLQTHPGWAVLKELCERRRRVILAFADPPTVHEQAEYALWHGMENGVRQMLDAPEIVQYVAHRREREAAQQVAQEA